MQEDRPVSTDASADVIDSMSVGYHTVSRAWMITSVNPAAEGILGRSAETLVGRHIWTAFPGARELEFGRVYEQVMTTGQPAAFDAHYPGLDKWFELRVQPIDDGIAIYFLDITDRKVAEEHAAAATRRAEFLREITDALGSDLDVVTNVNRLARLVLPFLGSWSIVSIADADGALVDTASWHTDPARRDDVARYADVRQAAMPGTIAYEAIRAGRPVALMSDAHTRIRARLDGDALAYFDALAPVASAVLPMVARGRTVGLLSLYTDREWSESQYEAAKDVAARAALALDNSLAYERARVARTEAEEARAEAEQARAEAEAATTRLALLARVSEALAGSDDPNVAVGNLARLVVPELADWSIVTLVDEEGDLRDVGVAHRDPERQAETEAYAARRSATLSDDSPLRQTLRTGNVWRSSAVEEAFVRRVQTSQAAATLASSLDPYGVAVIPLTARGRVFGALTIVTTSARGAHTEAEIAVASEVARRAGPVLDSAQSAHRARRLAESMQRSVLSVPPAPPGLDIVTRYRPAQADNEVGGDWYDHFDLSDGSTFVAIGDVMGHDTAAIAAMAQLRTLMRAAAWTGRHSPAEVITDTDSASRALGPGTLATALTAILDARPDGSVTMRWSAAGHPPALVVAPDGTASFLDPDPIDVPLGVRSATPRRDHTTTLPPGSLVLLYTDGLVEKRGRTLDAGLERLRDAVVASLQLGLDELLDKMLVELAPPGARHDDVAVLALRVADAGGGRRGEDRLLLRLPADTTAPGLARARLAPFVSELPATQRHDAAILTSELVTNALRHGAAPITLDVRRVPGGVRVAVNDHGAQYPVLPAGEPDPSQTSGRGILLTSRLSTSWGVDAAPVGKTVWFAIVAG